MMTLKRLWLWILRRTDKSVYICVGCNKITRGIGARTGGGWSCSQKCYEKCLDSFYWKENT